MDWFGFSPTVVYAVPTAAAKSVLTITEILLAIGNPCLCHTGESFMGLEPTLHLQKGERVVGEADGDERVWAKERPFPFPRPHLQAFRELGHLSEAALLLSAYIGSWS